MAPLHWRAARPLLPPWWSVWLRSLVLGMPFVDKRYIGIYLVVGGSSFRRGRDDLWRVCANVIALLGRNPTLTDRTEVWELALQLQPDPFWARVSRASGWVNVWRQMWAKYWWKPNQAHNGYIETYLNLGYDRCLYSCAGLILATFRKIRPGFALPDPDFGRFRLALSPCAFSCSTTPKQLSRVFTLFGLSFT